MSGRAGWSALGSAALALVLGYSGAATVAEGAELPSVGEGIYRPSNWIREFKLATSYLADPGLPEKAKIFYAYRLCRSCESLDLLRSERQAVRLARPVDDESGYLTIIRSPCDPSAGSQEKCLEFVDSVKERLDREPIFLLSPKKPRPEIKDRPTKVVSWDPSEEVNLQAVVPEF